MPLVLMLIREENENAPIIARVFWDGQIGSLPRDVEVKCRGNKKNGLLEPQNREEPVSKPVNC
jgi:hypothetical protein